MVSDDEVDYKALEKLPSEDLKELLAWGIQRQLRWAVLSVTLLLALLTVFIEINRGIDEFAGSQGEPATVLEGLMMCLSMFYVILVVLVFVEGRAIDYYYYVARIEEMWIDKRTTEKWWTLCVPIGNSRRRRRRHVFSVQKHVDRYIMDCKSNFLFCIRSASVLLPMVVFLIRLRILSQIGNSLSVLLLVIIPSSLLLSIMGFFLYHAKRTMEPDARKP